MSKLIYTILDTRCCPKCGKMDNDVLCSQCRFCSAYIKDDGFNPNEDE